jgi:hypothetical protein
MSYDNLFTNKLFTGDMNQKFWLNFQTAQKLSFLDSQDGAFFVIRKFNDNESKILNSDKSLRFDNNGNIAVKDNGVTLFEYKNPLTKLSFDIAEPSIVDFSTTPRKNFIMSNNLKWILAQKPKVDSTPVYYLLYNPIHRKSFSDFYASQEIGSSDGLNPKIKNLIYKYCEINAEPNTEPGKRRFADISCSCAMLDECIDKALGTHIDNEKVRNSIGQKCVCTPACEINGIDTDSWMSKINQSSFPKKVIKLLGECPPIKNIICNQELKAYNGDIKVENSQLTTLCGFEGPVPPPTSSTPTTPPTNPLTNPPTPTNPQTTQPIQEIFTSTNIITISFVIFILFLIFS